MRFIVYGLSSSKLYQQLKDKYVYVPVCQYTSLCRYTDIVRQYKIINTALTPLSHNLSYKIPVIQILKQSFNTEAIWTIRNICYNIDKQLVGFQTDNTLVLFHLTKLHHGVK